MGSPSIGELFSDLLLAFPDYARRVPPADQQRAAVLYARELTDVPPVLLAATVRSLMRTEEWFPSIARIRQAAAELALGLPSEGEALAQIEARMRWTRIPEDERSEPPAVHPIVREALDHVGGFPALRAADDQAIVRGQFGRLYREARALAVRNAQLDGAALTPAPERRVLGP